MHPMCSTNDMGLGIYRRTCNIDISKIEVQESFEPDGRSGGWIVRSIKDVSFTTFPL